MQQLILRIAEKRHRVCSNKKWRLRLLIIGNTAINNKQQCCKNNADCWNNYPEKHKKMAGNAVINYGNGTDIWWGMQQEKKETHHPKENMQRTIF